MDNNFNQQPQYQQPVQPQYQQPKQPMNLSSNPFVKIVAQFSSYAVAGLSLLIFIFGLCPQFKVSASSYDYSLRKNITKSESYSFFSDMEGLSSHIFAGIVVLLLSVLCIAIAVVTVLLYDMCKEKIVRIIVKAAPALFGLIIFLASTIAMSGVKSDLKLAVAFGGIKIGGTFFHIMLWILAILLIIVSAADAVLFTISDGSVKPFNPIGGPKAPKYQQPVQPQYQAPVQPQYQAPVQPQYQAPVQPQYQAPVQPQYQQPVQPQAQQPVQPQAPQNPYQGQ